MNNQFKKFTLGEGLKNKLREKVTREYYIEGQLDISKLCKDLEIQIVDAEFSNDNISGAIFHEKDSWKIYLNYKNPPKRKRFTAAHELGHYFSYIFDSHSKGKINSEEGFHQDFAFARDGQCNDVELEANEIAGELLMPEDDIRKLVTDGKTIEEISDYFNVSEAATLVRLSNLGYYTLETSFT